MIPKSESTSGDAKKKHDPNRILHIRCVPADKARWKKAAFQCRMRLTHWVTLALNDAEKHGFEIRL
jgi:hypothetical protein